ncbi:Uma2 family endonuclease, partial [bacterium]
MVRALPSNLKSWSFDQFMALAESGLFKEQPHVELIDGQIYDKISQNHPHFYIVAIVTDALKAVFGLGSAISSQSTVRLGPKDGPEPDIAVFRGKMRDYARGWPDPGDMVLVVEVGDSTVQEDIRFKAPLLIGPG